MYRRQRFFIWVLGLVAVWASSRELTQNHFTVVNESGQEIRELSVRVGGETFDFGNLTPEASVSSRFRIGHEEVFEVRWRLADGTEVHEHVGYVVWEEDLFGVSVRLTIRPEGMIDFSY